MREEPLALQNSLQIRLVTLNNVHSVAFYNVRNVASMTHTPNPHSAMQCQNHFLRQLILHPVLLQAHAVAESVVAKVVVECLFVWVEGWQVAQHPGTTEFFRPEVPV